MRVVYSAAAYSDLAQIYAWIANDSPRNAKSVIDRICDSIEVGLAFAPYMGRRAAPTARTNGWCAGCLIL